MRVSRKEFIKRFAFGALGIASGTGALGPLASGMLAEPKEGKKARTIKKSGKTERAVIIQFGGGCRFTESFGDTDHLYTPVLANLMAQGTLFNNVWYEGIGHHYSSTAGLITGTLQEHPNDFTNEGPTVPTIFESFRKKSGAPKTSAWLIPQGANFNRIGSAEDPEFGKEYAGLIVWSGLARNKKLASLLKRYREDGDFALSQLTPDDDPVGKFYRKKGQAIPPDKQKLLIERLTEMIRSIDPEAMDFLIEQSSQPNELGEDNDSQNAFFAINVMKEFAPKVLMVNLVGMDIAHQGYWSLYVNGIKNADRLTGEIWEAMNQIPAYAGKSSLFIIPDFGRSGDGRGLNGFQHHNGGDEACQHIGMLVLGPETEPGAVVKNHIESRDLAPTVAKLLGFDLPKAEGEALRQLAYR